MKHLPYKKLKKLFTKDLTVVEKELTKLYGDGFAEVIITRMKAQYSEDKTGSHRLKHTKVTNN